MKTLFATIAVALALIAGEAGARPAIVALAPAAGEADRRAITEGVAFYLAEVVQPGESARLLDARTGALLAVFEVPEGESYVAPRAKLQINRRPLKALKAYVSIAPEAGTHEGAMDLPGLLREIGTRYPADVPTDLVIWGSPVHHDPRMPSFSMLEARVPGDGQFFHTRAETPYAAVGEDSFLNNYRVFFGRIGPDPAVNDAHAFALEQYLGNSIAVRGGQLVGIADDPATLFEGASAPITEPRKRYAPQESDKIEMLVFAPQPPEAVDARALPIHERPLASSAPSAAEMRQAREVEVGITWDAACACDLDLYARPATGEVIYFANAETAAGRLLKDFTSSPEIDGGLERVVFAAPVDLAELRLAVNLYRGAPGRAGVTGEIRIAIGAETWAAPFRITAEGGSAGRGAAAVMNRQSRGDASWVVIDPLALVGLR